MEPVRFYDSIAKMREAGVTGFIEIGQEVLSGFLKKLINQQLFIMLKVWRHGSPTGKIMGNTNGIKE